MILDFQSFFIRLDGFANSRFCMVHSMALFFTCPSVSVLIYCVLYGCHVTYPRPSKECVYCSPCAIDWHKQMAGCRQARA